jgi:chromosome segregation ATPase
LFNGIPAFPPNCPYSIIFLLVGQLQSSSVIQLREAVVKVKAVGQENARLKKELSSALDELDSASVGFRDTRELCVLLQSQLDAALSKVEGLQQQASISESLSNRSQLLLSEEQQRSAALATELQLLKERTIQTESRNNDYKAQLRKMRGQLAEVPPCGSLHDKDE